MAKDRRRHFLALGAYGGPRDWWRIVEHWKADFWPDSTTLEGWTVKYQGKALS